MNHVAVDIGQPEMTALVTISEAFVVESQLVKNCGLKVVDMDLIFDYIITDFIRFPVNATGFDASSGHPHTISVNVVIAAYRFSGFSHWGSAKFTAPDNECRVEESP